MVKSRAPLNRLTAAIAVAVLVLASVLAGGAAAQTPEPKQYGPATPAELEALQQAARNVGALDNPVFEGGYPASMPEAPEVAASGGVDVWNANWATGRLCAGSDRCLVGDFNADGRDDVAVVAPSGEVYVALTKATGGFNAMTQWGAAWCVGSRICKVGDFNADGKDDLIFFNHGPDVSSGQVYVAISAGNGFGNPNQWHNLFCIQNQVCEVGNFDGVFGDDIALFRRNDSGGLSGDVEVARSNGFNAFGPAQKWQDYICLGPEDCRAGDLTGDGKTDVLAFVRGGDVLNAGRVPAAISTGGSFGAASDWTTGFCIGDDVCEVGDFNGDTADDVLKFVRTPTGNQAYGEVYVRLSNKNNGFGDLQRWKTTFCGSTDDCAVGDFNGDGRDDVIRFVKQSSDPAFLGAAYVALASGTTSGFVAQPAWLQGFCGGYSTSGNGSCSTGDFNGDGLTDIVYFVRDSQSGTGRGDVFVSLNLDGGSFGVPTLWQDFTCVGADICKVGDANRDGLDDLIIFSRVQNGPVYVARSTGSGFLSGEIWNSYFCVGNEVCQVGDFNGDGRVDIALFTRSAYGDNARAGDVEVAINTGGQFVNIGLWHSFFCVGSEDCQVGDVNGDGRDDIITFAKGSAPKVYVELSTGFQFGDGVAPAETWHNFFCGGSETCGTGDFNGDGKVDIAAFLQGNYAGSASYGDVFVGLSQGSAFAGGFISQKWHDYFCIGGETCGVGYFNNDDREDIVAFQRQSTGSVFVGLSSGGTGYYFADNSPVPAGAKRFYVPMIIAR